MQYKTTLFIIGLLLLAGLKCSAQYDNVWAFGDSAGIDFNSNPPKAIKTGIKTVEGCASICDDQGQLLFYTDGTTIWDRNNTPMPDGGNLTGTGWNQTFSTSQAAVIIPMQDNKKYYVFSLSAYQQGGTGSLYYCIVDMTLNGGMGDVVSGTKATVLATDLEEAMTAVPGNQCDIWLIVSSRITAQIQSYRISADGIDTVPVISPKIPSDRSWAYGLIGSMDVSPDRSKLVFAQGNLVLYDFDATRGKASNALNLREDSSFYFYGVSFSPDNTKLYASSNSGSGSATKFGIVQYDLSLGNAQSIIASAVFFLDNGVAAIRRAPDGKMYVAVNIAYLSVIQHPDLPGAACGYVRNGFDLNGNWSNIGLPNASTLSFNEQKNIHSATIDTAFCADSLFIRAKDTTGSDYKWGDGVEGAGRQVYHSGVYTLHYHVWNGHKCEAHTDEFDITIYHIKRHYTTTTLSGMCRADTITMTAGKLNGTNYFWEDEITTGPIRKINKPGTYWVRYQNDSLCEHYVDSFIVTYPEKDYEVSFLADTLVCANDVISFQNTSDPHFSHFIWSFGNGDSSLLQNPQYAYTQQGSYPARLIGKIDSICPDTAYQTIVVDTPVWISFIPDSDSICVGQSITFSQEINNITVDSLQWQFGDGTDRFSKDKVVQHAYDDAGIMPVTLSATLRACPDTSFTDTVYVYALPKVDLGPDSSLCLNGAPIVLQNLQTPPTGIYHNLWSTGDTTAMLKVVHSGTYSLTVKAAPLGCTNTAFITITKDCYIDIPNAFTPNGDGHNDYFFPRQRLSEKITRFKMQVFNRWGELVFETNNTNGRGWDGKFNGKIQPEGVYVYLIDADFANGKTEHYQGNVTLLR